MILEIWKDVVGYESIYEVSNYGRVRTHKNKKSWSNRHDCWRYWKQRVLKEKNPSGRDVRVSLWKDGKHKDFLVHRLVAFAFITEVENKASINHKDGNPRNNHVDNLEWCNHLENNTHAFENGLINTSKEVTLKNKENGESHKFRSMSKASSFLGKNNGYISAILKNGKNETDKFHIIV